MPVLATWDKKFYEINEIVWICIGVYMINIIFKMT